MAIPVSICDRNVKVNEKVDKINLLKNFSEFNLHLPEREVVNRRERLKVEEFFIKYKLMVRNRNAIDMELLIAVTRPRYFKPNCPLVLHNIVIIDGKLSVIIFAVSYVLKLALAITSDLLNITIYFSLLKSTDNMISLVTLTRVAFANTNSSDSSQ